MTCSRARGFTLVELMVTITVAAILTMIAVPNFTNAIRRNQVSAASNALLADLAYARTEAITRGTIVSICPSTNGTACVDPAGTAYESGWLVYTYQPGKAVSSTVYSAAAADGNIRLRYTAARRGVSIQAERASVISFGPLGETSPGGTITNFVTCYRTSDSGTGESSNAVPGVGLRLGGAGSVSNSQWAAGDACTVPASSSSSP